MKLERIRVELGKNNDTVEKNKGAYGKNKGAARRTNVQMGRIRVKLETIRAQLERIKCAARNKNGTVVNNKCKTDWENTSAVGNSKAAIEKWI